VKRDVSPERPLSVVVLGNSLSVLSIPGRAEGDGGLYAEVLRDRLVAAGVPARVHLEGRWFDFAVKALSRYEQSVRGHLPDVVVLQYGLNESQPWLLPVPVVRHFVRRHEVTTRASTWYRDRIAPTAWKQVRAYRRWAAARVGTRTWQTTPHRFQAALRQLIRATRYDSRALVLVLDVEAPGELLEHFLPGMAARHAVVQEQLRGVVGGFADDEVRLVEVSKLLEAAGPEAMVDQMHYSPLGHRLVGERLAQEVLDWLASGSSP
jgi:lysophospholipase L1-like esterase